MSKPASRPLHIVYVTAPGGGAETYVRQIAPALAAQGQRVTVLYIQPAGSSSVPGPSADGPIRLEYTAIPNGHYYYGRIHRLLPDALARRVPGPAPVRAFDASWALRRSLQRIARRSGGIDLIEFPEETAFPALFRQIAPYAVKLHSSDAAWRYFCGEGLRPDDERRIRLEAALLRGARLVSAPSAAVADHVSRTCRYPRERIPVLPYPMDLRHFSPAADGPDEAERPSVLYVGRMDLRKGLETLARAAGTILTAVPAATIDVVGGETPQVTKERLLGQIPERFHARVVFHGRVPHAALPGHYRRAAVCVVPSRWDNSPNTVYEAMGCGRPVVASRVGGIPELVTDGETGLLVPRDDPAALAAAVTALLADPERREGMGRAARAQAEARFDPAAIAAQTLDLYRAALSGAVTHAQPASRAHTVQEERTLARP